MDENRRELIRLFREAYSLRIKEEYKAVEFRKVLEGLIKYLNGYSLDSKENISPLIKSLKYNTRVNTLKVQTGIEILWTYFSELAHLSQIRIDPNEFESKVSRLKEIIELTLITELNMTPAFNPREYLSDDLKLINRMDKQNPLLYKRDFITLLEFWYENNKFSGFVRINEKLPTNNTPCVWVRDKDKLYRLNGDSTIKGVDEFLQYQSAEWNVIANRNGTRNKVVVTPDNTPIPGFYFYLDI